MPTVTPPAEKPPAEEPTEKPDAAARSEVLLAKAEALARRLVEHLEKRDAKGAKELLISEADLRSIMAVGGYQILAGTRLPQNERLMDSLMESVGGGSIELTWTAGQLTETRTHQTLFIKKRPMIIDSLLTLKSGGFPVLVKIQQLIFVGGGWKIFGMQL